MATVAQPGPGTTFTAPVQTPHRRRRAPKTPETAQAAVEVPEVPEVSGEPVVPSATADATDGAPQAEETPAEKATRKITRPRKNNTGARTASTKGKTSST